MQTLEYLYFADKYKDRKQALINRMEQEKYLLKLSKLMDWIENNKPYSYDAFLR